MAKKYNYSNGEVRKFDYYYHDGHNGRRVGTFLNHGIECYDVWLRPYGRSNGTPYLCSVQIPINTNEMDVRKVIIAHVRQLISKDLLINVPDEVFEYRQVCIIPKDQEKVERQLLGNSDQYKKRKEEMNKLKQQEKQYESKLCTQGSGELSETDQPSV